MAAPFQNKYALGNKGGRPPLFESAEALEALVIKYFTVCAQKDEKSTITGLALYLGFDSRQSLYDYEEKEEFAYIIRRAKLAVENGYELSGTTFDIFALKNMGWKDKTEQEHTGNIENPITFILDKRFTDGG